MKKLSTVLAFGLSLALLAPVYAEETTTAPAADGAAAKPAKKSKAVKKSTAVEAAPAADAAKPADAKPAGDAPAGDATKPAKKGGKAPKKEKEVKADAPTK